MPLPLRLSLIILIGITTIPVLAQEKIDSLLNRLSAEKDPSIQIEQYIKVMELFEDVQLDSAQKYLELAIGLAGQNELKQEQVDLSLKKAQYLIMAGTYEAANAQYDSVATMLGSLKNLETEATYNGDRGILNFYKGDFKEALKFFERALLLAEENDLTEEKLRFLNATALAKSYLGESEEAITLHKKAIELAQNIGDSVAMARSFNNIGLIYDDMDEIERALGFYEKSLTLKRKYSPEQDIINSLYNVANMQKELGERNSDTTLLTKAKTGFKEVYQRSSKMKLGKMKLFGLFGLAQLETVFKNYNEAISMYLDVIEQANINGDNQILRIARLNIGSNYLSTGKNSKALKYLNACFKDIIDSENPSDMAKLYYNLSLANEKVGNTQEALSNYKAYEKLSSDMKGSRLQEKIADLEVKYDTEQKEKEILKQQAVVTQRDLKIRKKNMSLIGLAILILLISTSTFIIFDRQKTKNEQLAKEAELQAALAKIETQNKMQEQRLRISRDLHDNIGSQLTFIISSIETLNFGMKGKNETISNKLSNITLFTKSTINDLRDTVWAMNLERIPIEDLFVRLSNLVDSAREILGDIRVESSLQEELSKEDTSLSSVVAINVYRCIQEALNNSIKHANPSVISIDLSSDEENYLVKIIDNGTGFKLEDQTLGNGIQNILKRMKDIGGTANINPIMKQGTTVELFFNSEDLTKK